MVFDFDCISVFYFILFIYLLLFFAFSIVCFGLPFLGVSLFGFLWSQLNACKVSYDLLNL